MITFSELGRYGRCGNQLFQIAATIGIAAANNDTAIFPKWYCNYTQKNMSSFFKNPIDENFDPIITYEPYTERYFHYSPVTYVGNINLHGYWQSYKYWEHCEELIKFYFEPAQFVVDNLKRKYEKKLSLKTCSIHVRKGDYVNNKVHDVCDIHYYNSAIERMKKEKTIEQFVVFSDNIKWCKEHFPSDFTFIENNLLTTGTESIHRINDTDIEELFLMSFCENNIISNSSFSWWGSYLNKNTEKTIIAPVRWFGTIELNSNDIYTKNMIRV